MKKSLYDTLEVEQTATEKDIKKAYLKKAKQKHPDKKGGNEKEFQEINNAYQVLSCPIRREHYDKTGEDQTTSRDRIIQAIIKQCLNVQDPDRIETPMKRLNDIINNCKQTKIQFTQKAIDIEADIKKIEDKKDDFVNYFNGLVEMVAYLKDSLLKIENEINVCEDIKKEFESVKKILGREILNNDMGIFFTTSTGTW